MVFAGSAYMLEAQIVKVKKKEYKKAVKKKAVKKAAAPAKKIKAIKFSILIS